MDNSISLDMSREAQSDRRIVRNNQEIVQATDNDMVITPSNTRKSQQKRLGKMIIISQKLGLNLGPHYPFFILGFIMVLTVSSVLVYCSYALIKNQQKEASIIRCISPILCIWVNLTYLITAFSDPGIFTAQSQIQDDFTTNEQLRYCQQCKIDVPYKVRHCYVCAVCIQGLDHHCPWMSKCVGKKNLVPFYAFLAGTFCTMALFWTTLYLILSR